MFKRRKKKNSFLSKTNESGMLDSEQKAIQGNDVIREVGINCFDFPLTSTSSLTKPFVARKHLLDGRTKTLSFRHVFLPFSAMVDAEKEKDTGKDGVNLRPCNITCA